VEFIRSFNFKGTNGISFQVWKSVVLRRWPEFLYFIRVTWCCPDVSEAHFAAKLRCNWSWLSLMLKVFQPEIRGKCFPKRRSIPVVLHSSRRQNTTILKQIITGVPQLGISFLKTRSRELQYYLFKWQKGKIKENIFNALCSEKKKHSSLLVTTRSKVR
jgi:hypothetical protein